jgi:hypothetical protein
MNLDKQEIKDILTQRAFDALVEIGQIKKVVRKGKIKKIHKAKNDAQKAKLSGMSKQKRRAAGRKSKKEKRKRGTLKPKKRTLMKRKKSIRKGKGLAGRG